MAYHDSDAGNNGGAYRSTGVDIETCGEGGYDVGWINAGEWLEYTVNLPDASAVYSVSARVASAASGGQMRLRVDGTVLGTLVIPVTGGWQSWQTIALPDLPIAGGPGSRALRLEMLTSGFNVNWVEFQRVQVCGTNDVASGRPTAASSIESANYPAANACDGDPRTRWSSAFSDPQWVSVDLGSTQSIARVRLNWEVAYARSYRVQVSSDNSSWTDLYTTTNGIGSVNDLAALGSGRYVRVYATQRGTAYGLYNAAVGLAVLPASVIAGVLWQGVGAWQGFGPGAPFLFGAAMALLAGLLFRRMVD